MNKTIKALKVRESSPFANFVYNLSQQDAKILSDQLICIHFLIGFSARKNKRNLVGEYKVRLGKQTYCMDACTRFWVWEYDGYRIYVNNVRGAGVEMILDPKTGKTSKPILECWQEYVGSICKTPEEAESIKSIEHFQKYVANHHGIGS